MLTSNKKEVDMNWDAIGATGEVIGAIAVFVTVAYLAVQLRQNTIALKFNSEREVLSSMINMAVSIAHTQLPLVMTKAAEDVSQLDKEEMSQFIYFLSGVFRQFEYAHNQHRLGYLTEDSWQTIDLQIKSNFSSDGVQKYWALRGFGFSLKFRDYIDGLDPASFPQASGAIVDSLQTEPK
jgi:hypothetical protein